MNPDESSPAQPASLTAPHRVTLSPYVNEQIPNWEELLSAHDVARLTRRPRWALLSLALIGRFPRKRRFHGRGIGWLRTDVIRWLAKDLRTTQCHSNSAAIARSLVARQGMLALEHSRSPHTVRKKPSACINSKRGSSDVEPCSPSPQTSSQVFAGSSRR